ncbi:MAG: Fe-S oxidoreductase, partial [Actinobacteria bacterium]|nr:Fe-S oxidoreductase [Actinomycetota bacterium]
MLEKIVMTILLLITVGAFLARSRDLVGYIQLGQGDDRRPRNWGRKLKDLLVVYFGQRKLLQWTIPGVMHFLIFWGFIILGSTIVEAFGAVYQEGFHIPLVGKWGPLGAAQDFFVA